MLSAKWRAKPCHLNPTASLLRTGSIRKESGFPFYGACMAVQSILEAKLKLAFRPLALDVRDESSQHEGHSGARPGGETHFRIYIVANAFEGKSRLEMHRMINTVLADELAGPVHALAIHASASGET